MAKDHDPYKKWVHTIFSLRPKNRRGIAYVLEVVDCDITLKLSFWEEEFAEICLVKSDDIFIISWSPVLILVRPVRAAATTQPNNIRHYYS